MVCHAADRMYFPIALQLLNPSLGTVSCCGCGFAVSQWNLCAGGQQRDRDPQNVIEQQDTMGRIEAKA